ncbi:MAG: hypothetical protein HQL15_05770 [Candidatus Omnitrophica bacterium]|nr:hypothetical protein [Candidatus Omnitrophota bacterium]
MKNIFLVLVILCIPGIAWSQTAPVAEVGRAQVLVDRNNQLLEQISTNSNRVLIKRIVISGFVLKDNQRLIKMMKSNQNKRLSEDQIRQIVEDVKTLYLEAGYMGLVSVNYKIEKANLKIDILLLSR